MTMSGRIQGRYTLFKNTHTHSNLVILNMSENEKRAKHDTPEQQEGGRNEGEGRSSTVCQFFQAVKLNQSPLNQPPQLTNAPAQSLKRPKPTKAAPTGFQRPEPSGEGFKGPEPTEGFKRPEKRPRDE